MDSLPLSLSSRTFPGLEDHMANSKLCKRSWEQCTCAISVCDLVCPSKYLMAVRRFLVDVFSRGEGERERERGMGRWMDENE